MQTKNSVSHLNNSKSKQKYSFSKAQRFPQQKKSVTPLYYSINSSGSAKSLPKAVFGTSKKTEPFEVKNITPAAKYNIPSSFKIDLTNKGQSTFGAGRQSLKNTNFSFENTNHNPGPGKYEQKVPKNNKKITIGVKTKNQSVPFLNQSLIEKNPGPGKYQMRSSKAPGGKMVSLSIRFKQNQQNAPGPGSYEMQKSLIESKSLTSSQCTSFSKANRSTYFMQKSKVNKVPGPGSYKICSQFDC